jgi:hypothetical protein
MWTQLALVALTLAVAVGPASTDATAADPAGYALLDKFVAQFERMARQGTDGAQLDAAFGDMITLARKARDESRIDKSFFDRYARVVRVFKLATFKDPDQILRPVVEREIGEFVRDVLGQEKSDVGALAEAAVREIDNLRKYLDTH